MKRIISLACFFIVSYIITRLLNSLNDMQESVFRELLKQGSIIDIHILETIPRKGKPAQKKVGSTTVWVIKFFYGDRMFSILEAARGGPREWASLDNLNNWLRACGVQKYQTLFLSDYDKVSQQAFSFAS